MGDAGWVRLGDVPDDSMFETRDGQRWWRQHPSRLPPQILCNRVDELLDEYDLLPPDTEARPLTPVPVAPDLDPTVRGLLLTALERGTDDALAALADRLAEMHGNPDVVAAVRGRCVALADEIADEAHREMEDGHRTISEYRMDLLHARYAAASDVAVRIKNDTP